MKAAFTINSSEETDSQQPPNPKLQTQKKSQTFEDFPRALCKNPYVAAGGEMAHPNRRAPLVIAFNQPICSDNQSIARL
jgi:hypothetical protein